MYDFKVKFGFHETITMFYIAEVSHAIKQSRGVGAFEEFLEKNPYLLDKTVIAQYYSHKHLYSDTARHQWVIILIFPPNYSLKHCALIQVNWRCFCFEYYKHFIIKYFTWPVKTKILAYCSLIYHTNMNEI